MDKIDTVLFDIGNVLSHDGHDTYLLHSKYGLALEFGITKEEMATKTSPVFRKYAVRPETDAKDFWRDIFQSLDIQVSDQSLEAAKQKIDYINPETEKIFKFLQENNVTIGVISNSTAVFYPDISKKLNLNKYIDKDSYFLSHIEGRIKSNGLFELAATRVNPATTLIIEDREKNIEYAKKLGFNTLYYSLEEGGSLFDLVKEYLEL